VSSSHKRPIPEHPSTTLLALVESRELDFVGRAEQVETALVLLDAADGAVELVRLALGREDVEVEEGCDADLDSTN
jgi:hypothetical protein